MTLIEARGVSAGYRVTGKGLFSGSEALTVVRDVDFVLPPGRTLGIVGESGCGKSTLGRALLRLLEPTAGQVLWNGEDMSAWSPAALRSRRSEFQLIFQDPVAALDPRMTLARIVSRPLATFQPNLSAAEGRARAEEAMALVGLPADFMTRYPHELSGGQAQRVGIARAIVANPRLIVCDEPVSALDVSIQAQVVNLLMDLQERLGLALVFISHNLSVVRHISHQVMVMCLGRVVEMAPRDAFYSRPLHPYSQALMQAVPEPDPVREKGRAAAPLTGELPSVSNPPPGCVFSSRCPQATDLCRATRPELRDYGGRTAACHYIGD